MNQDNILKSLYSHETIYIPPFLGPCSAIEVQLGCSWRKCTFCDFQRDEFKIHPLEKVRHDAKILAELSPLSTLMFLLGENAFVMDATRLLKIFSIVYEELPNINAFSMYSRIDDIARKTDEELSLLAQCGLQSLHIGVESGNNVILKLRNKGVTAEETVKQLHRLDTFGIAYYITIIPGLGGRSLSKAHAIDTAALLSKITPKVIWALKLKLWEGTPLFEEAARGEFDEMTPLEILKEERLMLSLTDTTAAFVDSTVLDKYTVQGVLPDQKEKLLANIDHLLSLSD